MTGSFLLVDAGNSFVKWAIDNGRVLGNGGSASTDTLDLRASWAQLPVPDAVCVSSVACEEIRKAISNHCAQAWQLDAQFIQSMSQQLGVTNCYAQPTRLGSDRWAALIGARALYQCPLAVIDCGTAVTIDAMNSDGEFIGGVIFPGMDLMRHSLQDRTQYINEIESTHLNVFGSSTGECVRAGAEFAVVGGLDRVLQEFMNEFGEQMKVLLTGGQAQRVQQLLNKSVILIPDLVLQGLTQIIRSSKQSAGNSSE